MGGAQLIRNVLAAMLIVAATVLAGCAHGPEPRLASDPCCTDLERYPRWLVAAAEPVAPVLGNVIAGIAWRRGHLSRHPDAVAAVLSGLRPLDIIVVSSKGRLSGQTIPGLFGHAAVYLGTEAQLRSAGLWPAIRSEAARAAIRAGAIFLEADQRGVTLSKAELTLDVDRVVVMRPRLRSHQRRRAALATLIGALGQPFDFRFDLDSPACVFCTELVHRAMPELGLEAHTAYGRRLILPDAIARGAVLGQNGLAARRYVVAERDVWRADPVGTVIADINAEWSR